MGLTTLLSKDPLAFFLLVGLLLYSVIAHEVAHGWVAKLFGDTTAQDSGRLTLNPLSHIDLVGMAMMFFVGFGWAKPVPVNYPLLRQRGRIAPIAVSLAGVTVNFLIACAAVLILRAVPPSSPLANALAVTMTINISLAAFNLIPIPPLDGSNVLAEFLPLQLRIPFFRLGRFGFFVLIVLLYTRLLDPVIHFMQSALFAFMALVLNPFL